MSGVARRVAAWPALGGAWLVRGYQAVVSPLLAPRCRFFPTCSEYAVTALRRHGLVRGGALTLRRLVRCQPFHPGGVDHVPPRDIRATGPGTSRGCWPGGWEGDV
ncbi:MAG: membrane protein insertion efficiency factor YidD [Bifidobacteriaceae bacterium]|nr:membrane protein insertion efficiency factor YidD [Bifidobacteriaceae bacterium]